VSGDKNDCNRTFRLSLTDRVISRMHTNLSTAVNTALCAMTLAPNRQSDSDGWLATPRL